MSESAPQKTVLTQPLILLMAFITGVAVSNLYYIQPIQALVATTFHVTSGAVGTVAMLTQVGYALGLLLIVPFGDVMSRYQLILRMAWLILTILISRLPSTQFHFLCLDWFDDWPHLSGSSNHHSICSRPRSTTKTGRSARHHSQWSSNGCAPIPKL